jgi:class 3 adenylate cyclase
MLDEPTIYVGRDPNSDVVLHSTRVSRRHLELRLEGDGRVYLQDSSSNGTFLRVAGEWVRVEKPMELKLPFIMRVAHWTIRVDQETAAEPVADEPEQAWDQSVMIPVANLGQRTEAILVFDICESSLIASKDDHMAYHLKNRLTQIAEPVLNEYNRRFFKSTGDGFLATFEDAGKAMQAAIKLEDHIQYRNQRTSNLPIHYRIALHYGEVWAISAGGDDVHGNDVNITFRIEGAQAPAFKAVQALFPKRDRILCSERFKTEAGDSPQTAGCVACGAATLKGIVEPVNIFWVKTQYSEEDLESTLATQSIRAPR